MSRIGLILPNLACGGAERVLLQLAREFVLHGHEVYLLLFQADGQLRSFVPKGVRVVDLRAGEMGVGQIGLALSAVIRLSLWLRRQQPETVLSTITGANLVAILARKMSARRIRLVIREASTLDNVRSALRHRVMRWLYRQADAVVTVSPTVARDLSQMIGVSSSRIHQISNPVDVAFVRKQGAAELRHEWMSGKRVPVIISVGRLSPPKDNATLIHAFCLLQEDISARLVFLGEGPDRGGLESLIVKLEVADRVQFIGFDLNPWRWMARADLYVLSSRWEGHPNALLEALALGLPAVATSYDESVLLMAKRFGFAVVPTGDARSMARAIKEQLLTPTAPVNRHAIPDITSVAAQYLDVLHPARNPVQSA